MPEPRAADRALPPFAAGPVAAVAAVYAAVLTALSGRYGFHRDELYFLQAGHHLAWGYVDQPPLTPLLARASTAVFGTSPMGLRAVATAAGVLIVLTVALLARETGAGRAAQLLAAAATAVSSMVLMSGHLVSTATFDLLAWLVICLLAARLLRTGDRRWYPAIGAATGIALLNKDLAVLLIASLAAGVLLVGPRPVTAAAGRSWPWAISGVVLALLIVAPNLWWQARHGWPQLTVASGIDRKDGMLNRATFVPFQFVYLAPTLAPLWIAGWLRLWRDPDLRRLRAFTVAYPVACVVVLVTGGKCYYVLPLLLVLLAAGTEPVVGWAARGRGWNRPAILAAGLLVTAVIDGVATLPVLPPSSLSAVNGVNKEQGEQVGWPKLVATVAGAWKTIPADQRLRAVILTQNYGEAGAIAMYGPGYGLPEPYSGHMSYSAWGPPPDSATGPVLLVFFPDNKILPSEFTGCRLAATVDDGVGLSNDEQGAQIEVCSGLRGTWSDRWPALRSYY